MRLRSDTAGFTLLEALVALAILSLVTALVATAARGPSPRLALQRLAAERIAEATEVRLAAIRSGVTQSYSAPDACNGLSTIIFHPNGTASGADLCILHGDITLRIALDPVAGRLSPVPE